MKAARLLLIVSALAGCTGPGPLPGLEKQWQRVEAARRTLEACLDTPQRYHSTCTAESAAYDVALEQYRAASTH
jgi:hypothetical protein